ncbi:hypothetical protein TNCV_4892901 [Trichonephila clavipes]|nr:hypothetical protein TNCV_4892901 [Trichonephila clavipes]
MRLILVPLKTRRVEGLMNVKSDDTHSPQLDGGEKEEVRDTQVSASSLGYGSTSRAPSPLSVLFSKIDSSINRSRITIPSTKLAWELNIVGFASDSPPELNDCTSTLAPKVT